MVIPIWGNLAGFLKIHSQTFSDMQALQIQEFGFCRGDYLRLGYWSRQEKYTLYLTRMKYLVVVDIRVVGEYFVLLIGGVLPHNTRVEWNRDKRIVFLETTRGN
jgi:hypothetical protein